MSAPKLAAAVALFGITTTAQIVLNNVGTLQTTTEWWVVLSSGSGVVSQSVARAWRIDDTSTVASLYFEKAANPTQIAQAMQHGWTLRAVLRMPVAGDAVDRGTLVSFFDGT